MIFSSLSTAQAVMLVAFASACSRASLNLIDRIQIGHRGVSIVAVNFWNNAVPAVVLIGSILAFGGHRQLALALTDPATVLFSGLVQVVAYAYSHAFRRLTVSQVTVAGKAADLLIPVGVFLTMGEWSWATYGFAVATTLLCMPLLMADRSAGGGASARLAALFIGSALLLQASLSPLLVSGAPGQTDMQQALMFAASVIVWRVAWSSLPLLWGGRHGPNPLPPRFLWSPLFLGRVTLSILTQATFVLAVGSPAATVAWPILNCTGILSMVLSSLLLRERPSRLEAGIVVAIGGLAFLRFLSL